MCSLSKLIFGSGTRLVGIKLMDARSVSFFRSINDANSAHKFHNTQELRGHDITTVHIGLQVIYTSCTVEKVQQKRSFYKKSHLQYYFIYYNSNMIITKTIYNSTIILKTF